MLARHEKRGTPRITTIVPVHCRVLALPVASTANTGRRGGNDRHPEFDAKTINVSRNGMLINTEVDLWPRTELEVTLTSPVDGNQIRMTAEVAWSRRNAMNLFGRYGAGIRFKVVSDRDMTALSDFFKPL